MASESIQQRLQAEFDSPPDTILAAIDLLERRASVEYVSHHARNLTANMGEERLHALAERLHFLQELEVRKHAIVEQAQQRGTLDDALGEVLETSVDQDLLDDIYQSLRPKRRTPGVQAEEKGLGPLALAIQHRQLGELTLQDAAREYVSEEQGLPTPEAVLEGVVIILAERFAGDPKTRSELRRELSHGLLRATAVAPDHKGAKRYQEFFDFQEPVRRISSNRMLALRRAEREGILSLDLVLPEGRELELLRARHVPDVGEDSPLREFFDLVFRHAYDHYLHKQCSGDVRRQLKERADRDAVRTCARNLRSQLLAPPMGHKKVLAVRSSTKKMWAALLGEDGSVLQHKTLPLDDEAQRQAAATWLQEILATEKPAGIALPHGRRQGGSEKLVTGMLASIEEKERPVVVPVDEAASAIHATSAAGRKALPGVEVGVRTAISLGRRLQDPLRELIGMDPHSLGLGHVLDEVHQGMLHRELDAVVASCLASVGVDVNTADADLLAKVPGLTKDQAKALFTHRRKNGGFKTRADIAAVPGIGADTWRWVAGFLVIEGGDEPLDATRIHPDDYELAKAIAAHKGVEVSELFGKGLRDVDPNAFVGEGIDRGRVIGVLMGLQDAGSDARGELISARNEGVNSLEDLQVDMQLIGRITHLTEFGAFVDLGVGQDGLVHLSQIPPNRLHNPDQMLRVGEVVKVFVLNVDQAARKISLSLFRPRHLSEGRQPTVGERLAQSKGQRRRGRPQEDPQVMSRAARAPDSRRGDRRSSGRRPPQSGERGDRGDRPGGRPGGRRDGPPRREGRGPSGPRVFTVESGKEAVEQKGHKGELTSLAGLRSLLGAGGDTGQTPREAPPPDTAPQPAAPGPQPEDVAATTGEPTGTPPAVPPVDAPAAPPVDAPPVPPVDAPAAPPVDAPAVPPVDAPAVPPEDPPAAPPVDPAADSPATPETDRS